MDLTPRPVAASVDELLDGAVRLGEHRPDDARSSAGFERVVVDGEPCVVKYVHPDGDFTMRVSGDLSCRPLRVWQVGLMDVAPDLIDHGHLGAAPWGRNGWGAALLMRDLADELIPVGDDPVSTEQHLVLLSHCAGLAARTWGWEDDLGFLPHHLRWAWFGEDQMAGEAELGFPEAVPRIATEGWERFFTLVPDDVAGPVGELRRDPRPLSTALQDTPQCFLHGDWKFGNLGSARDGRTVLIDWAYPGQGPACHELGWYLALNRARLPMSKEDSIAAFRASLEGHGVSTDGWWERQLGLCLLGTLVQFGWEKALGDEPDQRDELGWWVDAAREGLRLL
jgi:Phosphotransferase enzyme family